MRKHVLFFVHGMGVYVNPTTKAADNRWSQAAAATLKEQYEKYPVPALLPFNRRFEVIHLNYDTVFHKILTRWQEESQRLNLDAIPQPEPLRKLIGFLDDAAGTEDNFEWTHFADVVLYRFVPLVRQRVKVHVANQVFQALAPNGQGVVFNWSVVAHSLGTIVIHDVLHAMDKASPAEEGIRMLDAMTPSASVVAMMANVSKVMETDVDVYDETHVVPASAVQQESVCFNYLSCNNRFDPFTRVDRFDPGASQAWTQAKRDKSYLDIGVRNIHDVNTHSIRNYLVNPAVHIPLLERLVGVGAISRDEREAAEAGFRQVSSEVTRKAADKLLKEVKDEPWFDLAIEYFRLLQAG